MYGDQCKIKGGIRMSSSSGFIKVDVVMIRNIIICTFKTIGLQRKMSDVMIINENPPKRSPHQ